MNLVVIKKDSLIRLREIVARRLNDTHALGVALWEYETRRSEIGSDQFLKIGSLLHEFETHRDKIVARLRAGINEQASVGRKALIEAGVDVSRGAQDIDLNNGAVKEMRAGQWCYLEKTV